MPVYLLFMFMLGFGVVTFVLHPVRSLKAVARLAGALMVLLGAVAVVLHTTGSAALLAAGLAVWALGALL